MYKLLKLKLYARGWGWSWEGGGDWGCVCHRPYDIYMIIREYMASYYTCSLMCLSIL